MKVNRREAEVFGDLEALCATSGYIHVLAYFSFRDNYVIYADEMTAEDLAASYVPQRLIRTELSTLIGLMLRHDFDSTPPEPVIMQSLIDETVKLLGELRACLRRPMFDAIVQGEREPDQSPFSRGELLREPIFYGGESAYNFQYRDFAAKRYAKDDHWLLANKGFRMMDAHAVAGAISRIQHRKIEVTLAQMREQPPDDWTILPGFTFSLDEVIAETSLNLEVCAAVLGAFSVQPPPTNAGFTSLGEFNITNALPLLPISSGKYVCLQTYELVESLYDSPYYWMAEDPGYRETACRHRGEFTELIVASSLANVFGASRVFTNVEIYSGKTRIGEIDVLVLFADRAVVVQCKSKKLTLEARKGNDLQLREDFKKAIQESYTQGLTCAKALSKPDLRFVCAGQTDLVIRDFKEIYIVCVVSDHYPALSVQSREFLQFETTKIIQPPLVTDVFLIDVLAEMLDSPLKLLSYLNRRVNCGDRIGSINELTTLSYHLLNNLWFDDEMPRITLGEDIAMALDTVMMVRREGLPGERTPKGILTQFEGTLPGRILAGIEHQADAVLIDLGFLLLTISGKSVEDLDKGLVEISRRTRADGQLHDFTLALDDGSTGLTIHCSELLNTEAMARLHEHCRRRKYVHRASSWFGLVIRAEDGLPEFGIQLNYPMQSSR